MILVITHDNDAHGKYIMGKLTQQKVAFGKLDYGNFPSQLVVSMVENGRDQIVDIELSDGRVVRSDSVISVLNRRRRLPRAASAVVDKSVRDYVEGESQLFLDSLPLVLDAFWVSNPDKINIAAKKPYHLSRAREIGFTVPPTYIGNSPQKASNFLESLPGDFVAIKALGVPHVGVSSEVARELMLYTARVRKDKLPQYLGMVNNAPVIFQPYIEKEFELRITVVGGETFACAIYSQATERTKHDWRRYDIPNTPHKSYKLPLEIREKCVKLVEELGLVFGCIDMIVTPEDDYVFLEINPNGQWLWLERLTDLKISDALIAMLIRGGV